MSRKFRSRMGTADNREEKRESKVWKEKSKEKNNTRESTYISRKLTSREVAEKCFGSVKK